METPATYTVAQLAACDHMERRKILHELLMGRISIDEADEALEQLTAQRILEAQRGLVDDGLPLAEERSTIAKALYGDGRDEL